MAKPLDLEEQEQLDEIKHFWKKYGDRITWVMAVVFGVIAVGFGYQYWQREQAAKASVIYDELVRAAQSGDEAHVERALSNMQNSFSRTVFAEQASLVAAKSYYDKNKLDAAKSALTWVAEKGSDEDYKSVAKLRLAAILLESKAYDQALLAVSGPFPKNFEPLAADRRGDVLALQGKKNEAKAEYEKAYKGLDERAEYRLLVEVKLYALGVNSSVGGAPAVNLSNSETKK